MKPKNFIPWWEPQIGPRELPLVTKVLKKNYINEGEVTSELERKLCDRLGVKHAVATSSGTAALFMSLAACGVGPGDEVIVPDLTFIATANAVRLAGATVVLCDIDPRTLTLDPDSF